LLPTNVTKNFVGFFTPTWQTKYLHRPWTHFAQVTSQLKIQKVVPEITEILKQTCRRFKIQVWEKFVFFTVLQT